MLEYKWKIKRKKIINMRNAKTLGRVTHTHTHRQIYQINKVFASNTLSIKSAVSLLYLNENIDIKKIEML